MIFKIIGVIALIFIALCVIEVVLASLLDDWYEKRVKELRAALDFTDPESIDKNVFYKAVLVVIDAVRNFTQRYSKLAKELADKETDAKRKEELLQMSEICAKVPYEPATSFREAVQSVWFIQCILQIESNGHSLSYGRFDQYMYPYYIKDINEKIHKPTNEILDISMILVQNNFEHPKEIKYLNKIINSCNQLLKLTKQWLGN